MSYYIKKLGKRGKITIWEVDGTKIRAEKDEEFTNFGQHYRFPYIPEYEFWLDVEADPNERRFFIAHLLVEWEMQRKGISFNNAIEIADATEKAERMKSKEYLAALTKDGTPNMRDVHKKILKKLPNDITVWLIDGDLVRSYFRVEFVAGGHEYVYSFVPKNEVWIDDDLVESEIPFVALHELYERGKMKKGMVYNKAHFFASKIEWKSRQDPELLKKNLANLGWK